jgi:glucose-6-phosphate dehydrogenase assembly protein OpcA
VADAREDAADVGETLASLMRDHPSRAIVVRVSDEPGHELEARVLAQCWMPQSHRQQICCEQIEISASSASLADVPAVVLPLVVPDLPVILWSRLPRLFGTPALDELSRMAGKTVVDSAAFPDPAAALRSLASSGLAVADLAWIRLTRWRELIAQIFENPAYAAHLPGIATVTISHPGATPTIGVRYMAAWLLMCLERAGSRPAVRWEATGETCDAGLGRIEFSTADTSLLNASVRKLAGSIAEVRLNGLTNRSVLPELSDYDLLREELSIAGRDTIFEATLRLAARS